jgi:ComF family protein
MEYPQWTIKSLTNSFLNVFFPETCLGCGYRGSPLCTLCARALPHAQREVNNDIKACFEYRDELVRKIIWNLKYRARSSIGDTLGALIYTELLEDIAEMEMFSRGSPILLIPIPLSHKRMKMRGYNQAEKIARGVRRAQSGNTLIVKTDLVDKQKDTSPQARISDRRKRLKNIAGAFTLRNADTLVGATVIVIDDVTTTGATLHEVITLIRKAGATHVIGVAFAH